MHFKGLYTAIITPFKENDAIDEEGLRENLRHQIASKVQGIVVLGSTGEAATLSEEERRRVIEIAAQEIKGKAHFIVGTGHNATKQTIAWTREAKERGAEGALIVTPYYNRPTQEGLFHHFSAVAEAVDLPICLYNVPSRTGVNLEAATLKRLSSFKNILSIKEASGNMAQIQSMLDVILQEAPQMTLLSGDDALTLPIIALGGAGLISVAGNIAPKAIGKLIKAALDGNYQEARKLQLELLPLFEASFVETNPGPIKAAMEMTGRAAGRCRLPLVPLEQENLDKVKALLGRVPSHWLGDHG